MVREYTNSSSQSIIYHQNHPMKISAQQSSQWGNNTRIHPLHQNSILFHHFIHLTAPWRWRFLTMSHKCQNISFSCRKNCYNPNGFQREDYKTSFAFSQGRATKWNVKIFLFRCTVPIILEKENHKLVLTQPKHKLK